MTEMQAVVLPLMAAIQVVSQFVSLAPTHGNNNAIVILTIMTKMQVFAFSLMTGANASCRVVK